MGRTESEPPGRPGSKGPGYRTKGEVCGHRCDDGVLETRARKEGPKDVQEGRVFREHDTRREKEVAVHLRVLGRSVAGVP